MSIGMRRGKKPGSGASLTHNVREIALAAKQVQDELCAFVVGGGKLGVVQAPPGSGKTYLLIKAVQAAYRAKMTVAVATQTNAQADDLCRRLARECPAIPVARLCASGHSFTPTSPRHSVVGKPEEIRGTRTVIVSTAIKFGFNPPLTPRDVLFIDEAWQLCWADFMLLGNVAERFVLIGDPGQIAPVVTLDVSRWETTRRPPHLPAPGLILADRTLGATVWALPATRRLPYDSVPLVQPFYDFAFSSIAAPGSRSVHVIDGALSLEDRAISRLRATSVVGLTMPALAAGSPLGDDRELAALVARTAVRLLERQAEIALDGEARLLTARDIGVSASYRVMNGAIKGELPSDIRSEVRVDTPERWQGLERPIMLVVHPLSGVIVPESFSLGTGRLCVMASRHQVGLIVFTRDNLRATLEGYVPNAAQAVGRSDTVGRGLRDHLTFWNTLVERGAVVE